MNTFMEHKKMSNTSTSKSSLEVRSKSLQFGSGYNANPVREKLLYISSNQMLIPQSPTESFSIQLPRSYQLEAVELCHVAIPNVFFNIDSSNQVVPTNLGNFTLPIGIYTSNSLPAALNTGFSSVGANVTVAYNTLTYRFMFTNSGTAAVTLQFGTGAQNNPHTMLGFYGDDVILGNSGTISAQIPANFLPFQSLFIDIPQLTAGIGVGNNSYTFIVPVTANSGDYIMYNNNKLKQKICLNGIIDLFRFDVNLRQSNGSLAALYGDDWEAVIRIWYRE